MADTWHQKEKNIWIRYAITAVVIIAVGCLIFLTRADVLLGETGIELNGGLLSKESIAYADITTVRWEDMFERGSRNFGTSTFTVSTGIYQNNAGSYFLCAWKSVPACIVVEHAGKRSTFNAQTGAETRALYAALLEKTAAV